MAELNWPVGANGPVATGPGVSGPVGAAENLLEGPGELPLEAPLELGQVQWRRVHKITPAINTWHIFAAIVAFLVYQQFQLIKELLGEAAEDIGMALAIAAVGLLVILLVGAVYSYFAWRRIGFAVTNEAVVYRQGILFRSQKQARLVRIQAVDIVQPILGRIFGLGALQIETAGGADSVFDIKYLKESQLHELRAEVLAKAAGIKSQVAGAVVAGQFMPGVQGVPGLPGMPGQPGVQGLQPGVQGVPGMQPGPGGMWAAATPLAPVAPERQLYEVPVPRLIGSLLASPVMFCLLAFPIVMAVIWLVTGLASFWVFLAILGQTFIPVLVGVVAWYWNIFNSGFNFRAAVSPDGIRTRHGLLQLRNQTLPPGRVHAIKLRQGIFWRKFGWWRVDVNVAGYAGKTDGPSATTLLPVGTQAEAHLAMWLVLRDLGVPQPQATLHAAFFGKEGDGGFTPTPRRARWIDPFSQRRRGVLVTDTATIVRYGIVARHVSVIPHQRVQAARLSQGPLQRLVGVATLRLGIVAGVTMSDLRHLDLKDAERIFADILAMSRLKRETEGPEAWMQRVSGTKTPQTQ